MKVISCNIGKISMLKHRGKDIRTGINKYPVQTGIQLGIHDVASDHVIDRKHHGGVDQACYIYGHDQYKYWEKIYPDLDWHFGLLGENLTIEGLDESNIYVGQAYKLGTAVVEITKPRQPCYKLGIILGSKHAIKAFWDAPYPGIYLKIIETGEVKVGDHMRLIHDVKNNPSILDVYFKKRKEKT